MRSRASIELLVEKGYQFEFLCDRYGNGVMTEFRASVTGYTTSGLRAAGNLFGGLFGNTAFSAYEIERAVQDPGHDKVFHEAVEEAKPNFRMCPKCSQRACVNTCWNQKRGLCNDCAPDVQPELAAAQAQATDDQTKTKVATQHSTKDIDLTSEAAALCPVAECGPRARNSAPNVASPCARKMNARAVEPRLKQERNSVPSAATKWSDLSCPPCREDFNT